MTDNGKKISGVKSMIEKKGQSMDAKEVTVTIKLPTQLKSLHELEMTIHTEGQRIKQQLFEQELQAIIDEQKEKISDEPIACPHCQKKTAFSSAAKRGN